MTSFRFYEELNEFLAPERRGREFACPCARAATTKHMIEALGVPHTEVELVLVNGESVGFETSTLVGADLNGARLTDVTFDGSDLRGAELSQASCERVDLRGALGRTGDVSE